MNALTRHHSASRPLALVSLTGLLLMAGFARSTSPDTIPAPIAVWSFDTVSEDRQIPDGSDHDYHGTVLCSKRLTGEFNPELGRGIRGRALTCGGSQQYGPFMSVTEPPALDGPFTLTLWMRPSGGQWITRVVYFKPAWLSRKGFEVQLSSTSLALVLCPPGARKETRHWVKADRPVHVNAWSFVAVRWDGNEWSLFLNGRLSARETNPQVAFEPVSSAVPLNIGGYNRHTNNIFCGHVDETRLFDQPLSDRQIRAVMLDDLEKH